MLRPGTYEAISNKPTRGSGRFIANINPTPSANPIGQ
jgi:hypothetical protein